MFSYYQADHTEYSHTTDLGLAKGYTLLQATLFVICGGLWTNFVVLRRGEFPPSSARILAPYLVTIDQWSSLHAMVQLMTHGTCSQANGDHGWVDS